ncbi:hypothetical protein [Haloferax volcanii]
MDAALEYKLDTVIALLYLLLLIESYRVSGYFGAAFVVIVTIIVVVIRPE